MLTRARGLAAIGCAIAVAAALTACAGAGPDAERRPASALPSQAPSSAPLATTHVATPQEPAIVPGPEPRMGTKAPSDPAALARAARWLDAAAPPPGVRALDAAPADVSPAPAHLVDCKWLVRAMKWWTTDASNVPAAKAWLTAHPIHGLAFNASMQDSTGDASITEAPPQDPDDSVSFEFTPGSATFTITVDIVIVPAGSECESAGGVAVSE